MKTLLVTLVFFSAISLSAQNNNSSYGNALLQMSKSSFTQTVNGQCATFTLSNPGNAPLVIEALTWSANAGYEFSPSLSLPLTIAPGEQVNFEVCNTTAEIELPLDTLQVTSNSRRSIAWGILADVSRSMVLDSIPCEASKAPRLEAERLLLKTFIDSVMLYAPEFNIVDRTGMIEYSSERPSPGSPIVPILKTSHTFVSLDNTVRQDMQRAVQSIQPYGGTWTGAGLFAIIDSLRRSPLPWRSVLLTTDGTTDDNTSNLYPVSAIIQRAQDANVRIYAVNIASASLEAEKYLDSLANGTGGKVFMANSCEDIDLILPELVREVSASNTHQEPFPQGTTLSVRDDRRENASLSLLNVYNTSSRDEVTVELNVNSACNLSLSLYDMNGKVVGERDHYSLQSVGKTTLTMSLDNTSTGTYLLVVETDKGELQSAKIVIE
ncbi:MAG: VWA domain-containing protein [Candidatus Kapaibacterium sp.]